MDRAAGGEAAAFDDLARRCQDGLFRFALAQGLAESDAVDVVQEALLRAWRGRRRWRRGGDAVAWLFGIAMNVIREGRRRRRRDPAGGLDETLLSAPYAPHDGDDGEMAALAACLADLPARQREAVACRYLRGLSVRDTAAAMGCAEGTVKAAVFAGLRTLRTAMARATTPRG